MAKFRTAIIGCGPRAHKHADAYTHIARGELVACCDIDTERLNTFTDKFGIKGYTDISDMIRSERPDLVHLVTAPGLRVQLMTELHELGVPACIVEKPIALEVEDWLALRDLEKRTNTRFAVNHQFRYHTHLTKCREALASGDLGRVLFVDFSARFNAANQGTHVLDYVMSLNQDSPVVRVFGATSGIDGDASHPAPATTVAQVVFENGVYGMWNTGNTSPRTVDDALEYKHCREAVYAERGRVLYEEFNRWEIVSPKGMESGLVEDWNGLNDIAQAGLTNSMFDWLETGTPSPSHLGRALHQWNAVLGIYASSLWRRPVDIPFEPPLDLTQQLFKELAKES